MEPSLPWPLLAKYFAGELSEEENLEIQDWIKADSYREQEVRKLYKIWEESNHPPYDLDVDQSWERLSGNMDKLDYGTEQVNDLLSNVHNNKPAGQTSQNVRTVKKFDKIKRLMYMTATAASILIAFLFAYHNNPVNEGNEEVYAIQQFVTNEGEWATYDLSDGSRVYLYPSSQLSIPSNFNGGNRELNLEGEAYFEVAHDPENPFILNAKHTYTRVLGTKFLVQAWADSDEGVKVVVSEGKVALGDQAAGSGNHKEAIITKSQIGILGKDEDPFVTDVDDLDRYLGWTEGRLVIDNRPLTEIISRLEKWYAIEIRLKDESLGEKNITAEIYNRQPMNEVLNSIALTLDLEWEKENRLITYRSKE